MKKMFSRGLVLFALIIGVGISAPHDCYAVESPGISGNTVPLDGSREQESNDTPATATRLTNNKIYGSLWNGSDQDVYKLRVPKTAKVVLNFYPNSTETDLGWGYDIEIYKKNGERAAFYRQIKKTTQKQFYALKGTYFVVVKANWSKSAPPATDDYAIAATVKSSRVPSLKGRKLSYMPKTSALKWKGVKGVDGYEIQVCKNKKFKASQTKFYTTVEKMYKFTRHLKRGTYYVRVRAYCDTVTGDRLYGKFTKVKKIKKK